jgi:DNA-binding NarL/FixJ family response regulator
VTHAGAKVCNQIGVRLAEIHTFGSNNAAVEANAPTQLDAGHSLIVFVVGSSRIAREALCAVFREIEPATYFFPVCSVTEIATPDAGSSSELLAVIYAGERPSSADWVRRELAVASCASIPTAVISESTSLTEVANSLQLGARGYILAESSFAVALSALKIVAAGEVYIPAQIIQSSAARERAHFNSTLQTLTAGSKGVGQARGWDALSWRERTVVELVCMGMPNKDIGKELGIATNTVKVHVGSIMKKLEVTNRTQLCAILGGTKNRY